MIKKFIDKRVDLAIEKKLSGKVAEFERIVKDVDTEKVKLQEMLSTISKELSAHEIWLKLWNMAFDEALRICWDMVKEKTIKITELTKNKALDDFKAETEKNMFEHNKKIEESLKEMSINKMSILNARSEAEKNFLIYNKAKDREKQEYFKGQLDLIERILNAKKD